MYVNNAMILTAQHDIDSQIYETTYATVVIEDYAVLYPKSIILPGRRIGYGAVVAAGAIVTHDVPKMGVVAGNPAKLIRFRKEVHSTCDLQRMSGDILRKRLSLLIQKFVKH